jgi:UDP-N-acetylglucosamine 2-epimerase (non-hydrolysing)
LKRVLFVVGTRPEAIKVAPLVHEFRRQPTPFEVHLCCTGQQPDLLEPVWRCFRLEPEFSLQVMRHGQGLASLCARLLDAVAGVIDKVQPHIVVVQGDTATTLCAAQAAFYQRVPVAHVEAGLRTYDLNAPFPEELHRLAVSRMATLHFAPTAAAAENLHHEGIPRAAVHTTGNTGIDALLHVLGALASGDLQPAVILSGWAGKCL